VQRNGRNTRDSILIPDYLVKKTNGTDSVYISRYDIVRALYVYNPNGTQASFSPIFAVSVSGKFDTLGGRRVRGTVTNNPAQGFRYDATASFPAGSAKSGVGLRADHQGNILAFYGGDIYRINYLTGAGMARIIAESLGTNGVSDGLGGLVAAGVDSLGNIFVNRVFPGRALKIYDATLAYLGNAVDTTDGFSRAITVTNNGKDIFYAGYDKSRVLRFHNDFGALGGTYTVADTVLKGFACESFAWNPKTKLLWASAGSYLNLPNGYAGTVTGYTPGTWYAYNWGTKAIVDSIKWTFGIAASANERPRAIAFSPGGDTAYVGVFGAASVPGIRMYVKGTTAVEQIESKIPANFTLEQNYPNPFNPSTDIRFSMKSAGLASLIIYDMLGREVALLVHEQLQPGVYKYRFDASSFPSGTYVYELRVGSERVAKKMMLLK
jgi:hypothetical protein